jgi:Ca2+-binding RTX toxin-like protein
LYYDSDGTGVAAAVQVATLTNTPASLAASDFVLVAGS